MTTLQATPEPPDPAEEIHRFTIDLLRALGIRVIHAADIPPSDIGRWDSPTSTLFIRADTTVAQQTWIVVQLLEFLGVDRNLGSGHTEPVLTVVPPL